ncbi:FAD-dependent oxidoreductase [Oleomonas cavernae]|uniref:FAD-dependent oxidoreductase n=1 Tax=Oleomonas cavernae TaxID=2320859 RepID=A0A418WC21_9PROT|nr:FAD-dependent oxidoreductase [Oleomonas cavernae]RJF87597.1 FAD-dependent oxidoreductase [Oleomonas cavernae]
MAETCDVAIVGGGPAGLAAATSLKRQGLTRVIVLEREAEAGGIPRHCSHSPFGLREFHRLLSGPAYARTLVQRAIAAGVEIRTGATVTALEPGGLLDVTSDGGPYPLAAQRVLLATGVRESPRAARLVSGERPLGIVTTGALQAMVHLKNRAPFRRPVIVGTELVSFSALLTCRNADIHPIAMIEAGPRTTARRPSGLLPWLLGVPLHHHARITGISGKPRVEQVEITAGDKVFTLDCDGILFTGRFVPEASLARMGHLSVDPGTGGPQVDQFGRGTDPAYYAAGNLLRPVETGGWSWREGVAAAGWIAADLAGRLPPAGDEIAVTAAAPLKYVMPQRLCAGAGMTHLQLRVEGPVRGLLVLRDGARVLWSGKIDALPERRLLVPVPPPAAIGAARSLELALINGASP